jgi:Protein of unknown function (DUF4058)
MPSPFPGMDPYLENAEFWSAVHNRLIVAIADDLVDHLNQKYRVEIEKRTYFSTDEDSLLVGIADVAVVTGRGQQPLAATATVASLVQPQQVRIPIPLLFGEEEPILNLQRLLNYVYDRGRYLLAIDYIRSTQPQLSEMDAAWAKTLLNPCQE